MGLNHLVSSAVTEDEGEGGGGRVEPRKLNLTNTLVVKEGWKYTIFILM